MATGRPSAGIDQPDLTSLSERISEILAALRKHLGLQVVFISEFVNDQRVFRYVDAEPGCNLIAPGDSRPLAESYCLRVVDGRLPSLIKDATAHPAALELPATLSLPIGAHLSVAIVLKDGTVFGTLGAFSTTPDPSLNERDVEVLRIVAHFLSMQIEPAHLAGFSRREAYRNMQSVIERQAFEIHYQPIYSLISNNIAGFEALTRFSDEPYRPPDYWFAEAGRAGLQDEMELAVIARALEDLQRMPPHAYLSLNVSPGTLLCKRFSETIAGHDFKRLVLELTEHVSIADYSEVKTVLEDLREKGMSVAIDDAGAGYSSFRHILTLRPDIIKLDRSLIADMHNSLSRRTLASALVKFSKVTGAQVVAEGVEIEEELQALKKLDVGNAQGYLLGEPAPLENWIK